MTVHEQDLATDYRQEVARLIRIAAARRNIKPRHVTEATGIPTSTVSRKFHGHAPITVEELVSFAFALEVNPAELVPVMIPATEQKSQDIERRASRLAWDVDEVASLLLSNGVTGADLGDWPRWAAAAHALRAASEALYGVGRGVHAQGASDVGVDH